MARLSHPNQKKNRDALIALGHKSTASAIAEIRTAMPDFDKNHNYPKVNGICPPLADIVLRVRGEKVLEFDHERDPERPYISGNHHARAARGHQAARGGDFTLRKKGSFSTVWHLGQ